MKQRFYFSVILLMLSLTAFAQQIEVKRFGLANQFIAAADRINDYDGDPCAVIKIQGAKIDSVSGAFEVRKFGAEVWAYMTDGDRRLTIYKQGYEPKSVVFKDYGVDDVKGNKVYLMTLFAPELVKQKLFVGLHGGVNFSTAGLGVGYGSAKWVTGFHIGASVTYKFTDIFGASTGLYFATRGYKYSDVNIVNEKGDFQFLDIPVMALLHFDLSDAVALQIQAGPYFSVNVGGKVTADFPWTSEKFSDKYSAFQVGGQGGFKMIFAKHYAIGADYQHGFGNYEGKTVSVNVGYIF